MIIRNEILEKVQAEGLAILKLHEKLNELNIEHDFVDRKAESIKLAESKKEIGIIKEIKPFDFQIRIKENGNELSLIQCAYSYGITQNLIEVYDFKYEPITISYDIAAVLINKKELDQYIIDLNEK